jgi:hypothetical protein
MRELIPVPFKPLSLKGKYFTNIRPGSLEILAAPSRMGSNLHYPREYVQSTENPTATGSGKKHS